jgi:hypothetical protein
MRSNPVLLTRSRRWWWWGAPLAALVGGLAGWWIVAWQAEAAQASQAASAPRPTVAATVAVDTGRGAWPLTAAALQSREQARQAQRLLWQQRLERAQEVLNNYREQTRYPHTSRPAVEQADQMRPNEAIVEEHPLREPKGRPADGVRLRTSQERVFVQGDESVRFTLAVVDAQGALQALRVLNASAREVTGAPTVASLFPVLPVAFNDDGSGGDLVAGDREYTAQLRPAVQGFAKLAGQMRLEVFLEYGGQRGFTYFDIYVTPDAPAAWSGGVRDVLEDGALNFYLGAVVREPGRYVVTGRVDDADGRPLALLTFNDEVQGGATEFRLSLFGKLVRDAKPAMPLTLRDVVAFRLREQGHPDRALMPRLNDAVHVSGRHLLAAFSDAAWSSDERARYLAELTRDVDRAQRELDRLSQPATP